MKTLHVGGISPLHRFKTLADALANANDDDTIELHKNIEEAIQINKNVIIHGNNHVMTVPQGKAGFKASNGLEIADLIFRVNPRANAIFTTADLDLTNVKVELEGPIRQFYPIILIQATYKDGRLVSAPKVNIRNSELMMLDIGNDVTTTIDDSTLTSYYKGDIMLSTREDMNVLRGNLTIRNSKLRSTILKGNATCEDCEIEKFVDVDAKAVFTSPHFNLTHEQVKKNAYKKEPANGPLANKMNSLYGIAVRPEATATINGYAVDQADNDYVGIFTDHATMAVENVNLQTTQITHKVYDSTLSFREVHDKNRWNMDNVTTAYVRSDVNSNTKYVTAKEKLDSLIGQNAVKKQVNSIMNTIEMNRKTTDKNFEFSYNMIFAGSPGTGKSTIAEIVAQALFEIGAIPLNKFTKATSDEFVKGYVGQTGENTRRILDNALGGVLFIDEAYELTVRDGENSFNSEVISVLIRYMEEHRKDLVVIAAGYTREMKEFLASNVGLTRRFQWIQFEDYSNEEMGRIFELMRKSSNDEYAQPELAQIIVPLFSRLTALNLSIPDAKGHVTNGGNGGLVRNVYQQISQARNNRVMEHGGDKAFTKEDIAIGFKSEMDKANNRRL